MSPFWWNVAQLPGANALGNSGTLRAVLVLLLRCICESVYVSFSCIGLALVRVSY